MVFSKSLQPLRSATKSLSAPLPAAYAGAHVASRRYAGSLANFKVPRIDNEPNVREEPLGDRTRNSRPNLWPSIITPKALCKGKGSNRQ